MIIKKIFSFLANNQDDDRIKDWLYHCNVAVRQKKLIKGLLLQQGIKTDVDGRLELLAVFLAMLVMVVDNKRLRQKIMNRVVYEIDDAYREQGVYDMVVGKRVKKLTAKLYARLDRYYHALSSVEAKKKLPVALAFYFGDDLKNKKYYSDYFIKCHGYLKKNIHQFKGFPKI